MTTQTCTACHTPVPTHVAIARGDLRTIRYWHRDCFTVSRAVAGVVVPVMPLTVRMALAAADERLKA
jgi:hypothetical protein